MKRGARAAVRPLRARAGGRHAAEGHAARYLAEAAQVLSRLDVAVLEEIARRLARLRRAGGRLFVLGLGGGAANASHAVNDFRALAGIEAYAPTDNVAELTARANDAGWESVFVEWLRVSRLSARDAVLVLSVGGGDTRRGISVNLVRALEHARTVGAGILGIVARDGGATARLADACVLIPTVNPSAVTPHAEAFQSVIWHLLVSHPALRLRPPKWESVG
jgi:D-sedoheptulose 7-phosphate isomerase